MKKLGKKKALTSSWEGPYQFVAHEDGDWKILILKKVAEYASFRMLMGISGKEHTGIYKSITFYKIKEAEGLNFFRKGGATYVTR